jgi:hypothetical protein
MQEIPPEQRDKPAPADKDDCSELLSIYNSHEIVWRDANVVDRAGLERLYRRLSRTLENTEIARARRLFRTSGRIAKMFQNVPKWPRAVVITTAYARLASSGTS